MILLTRPGRVSCAVIVAAPTLVAACAQHPSIHAHDAGHGHAHAPGHAFPLGSNEMVRTPIAAARGLEVSISDVIIPPNASEPWHHHPGEEYVEVIEVFAIHREEGQADIILEVGDTYVIRPEAHHSPIGGPNGARAIVFRVYVAGQPERIPACE